MMRLCFVLLVWLSVTAATAKDHSFDVLSYDVHLVPDFRAQTVSGSEVIELRSLVDGLSTVSFTGNELEIVVSVDGESLATAQREGDRWAIRLPTALRKGEVARLAISFRGRAPKGLVFDGDTVRSTYAVCDAMICDYDRPGDKARASFQLVLPDGSEAVAPGKPVGRHRWRTSAPVSAYLHGFAGGAFRRVAIDEGRPLLDVLTTAAPDEKVRTMFADTRRMLAFFQARAGVRLPAARYTQVLVEGSEAQEAAAHSTIGMDEISPILTDQHEDWVIAHELAHQWWGNAVTCADWSELWLNEGLTVFMVAAYKEQRWGRADYERELELANKRWAAAKAQGFDVPLSWTGSYPSLKLKRAMAYAKAVVFLDVLRRELGEDAFWRSIKRYTRANWDRTVTALDLQRAMERASGRDLSAIFATWVFGAP